MPTEGQSTGLGCGSSPVDAVEAKGLGWGRMSLGSLCPSHKEGKWVAWMWLQLQSFQEELGQLHSTPSSAIPFPGHDNVMVTVPMGSGCSSPSHPMLEEGSVMPPWTCASPQASSLPCAHPGPSGWAGIGVPAVPAWPWGGDRINLCSQHSSAHSLGISRWER